MTDCAHPRLVLQEGPINDVTPPRYQCKECNEFVRVVFSSDAIGVYFGAIPAAQEVPAPLTEWMSGAIKVMKDARTASERTFMGAEFSTLDDCKKAMELVNRANQDCNERMDAAAQEVPAEQREENREEKAYRLVIESGKQIHSSDCSTSIAPAEEPGPCDCDEPQPASAAKPPEDGLEARLMEILYMDANREAQARNLAAFIRTHQAARERSLLEKLEGLLGRMEKLEYNEDVCYELRAFIATQRGK